MGRPHIELPVHKLIIVCCLICLSLFAWHAFSRRSTEIGLNRDYHLTYTVYWGLGMEQRLALKHGMKPWTAASTGWTEILSKPYNSGAVVYANEDAEIYYIGTRFNMVIATLTDGAMHTTCDEEIIPKPTALAEQLLFRGTKAHRSFGILNGRSRLIPALPSL